MTNVMRLFSFRFGFGRSAAAMAARVFAHLDPGPLVDGDLELIPPTKVWVDSIMAACNHPLTRREDPSFRSVTRDQLAEFLSTCPGGRQSADPANGIAPGYHFWMRCHDTPDLPIAGGIGLRIGSSPDLERYYGHVGYHVYPTHRGRHYAERAVRLLLPLAARHGQRTLWITCNPDNWPSQRTCQRLGAALVDTVAVPADHALFARGEREKCRYCLTNPT
jgi:tagatose 1,6-diphosphate aldolase